MTRPLLRAAARRVVGLLVVAPLVATAACGATAPGSGDAPTAGLAVATAPPPDSADPDQDAPDAGAALGAVSANSAPEDVIAEALADAGVSNSARWAKEVVAHRPYPADDPRLTRLRDVLAAENPGPATVDKIIGALKP